MWTASLFVGVLLAAGCSSGDQGPSRQPSSAPGASTQGGEAVGTVSGGLYLSGMGQVPASGVVTLEGTTTYRVQVGADGRYSASVRPGTYVVSGHSPNYLGGGGRCIALKPAVVEADATLNLDVLCVEK
jgi:hypothetical protein